MAENPIKLFYKFCDFLYAYDFQEYSISSLMGHSKYKILSAPTAIEHFECTDMLYDRPDDIHLVHLRMGFFYIEVEEYQRARNVFLRASKHSPTCKTWLGVGMACYYVRTQFLHYQFQLILLTMITTKIRVWRKTIIIFCLSYY